MNAFRAGSIPICKTLSISDDILAISDRKHIKEYFNPDTLIDASDFSTYDELGIYKKFIK